MKRNLSAALVAAATMIVGCGELPPETQSTASAPAAPAPAPPGDGSAPTVQPKVVGEAPAPTAGASNAGAAPADAGSAQKGASEVAGVGVGAKGQNYGGPGLVTTPVEAYFRTGERIAFEVQIPNAMKLYKAEHNNKGPKTHEEFMEVIIKENGVQLPELPEGETFEYDPKTEQLMVRHPEK